MIKSKKAELFELDSDWAVFRYSIDEPWPETILIKIRRDRWERELQSATYLYITVEAEFELPQEAKPQAVT
jgi:hypothetical protein